MKVLHTPDGHGAFVAEVLQSPPKVSWGIDQNVCDTCYPKEVRPTKRVYSQTMDFACAACDACAEAHLKHNGFGMMTYRDGHGDGGLVVSEI